jgi:hypothetical protein
LDRQPPEAVPSLFDDHNGAGLQLGLPLADEIEQLGGYRRRCLILKSKNHDARQGMSARRKKISEVQIEREHDPPFALGQLKDFVIGQAVEPLLPKVKSRVTALA